MLEDELKEALKGEVRFDAGIRALYATDASNYRQVPIGVVLDHLRQQTEKYGLTFGPDPASHSRCTLGGMIGNNSCGVHAIAWGKTVDNVESLKVVTYDGLTLDVVPTPE